MREKRTVNEKSNYVRPSVSRQRDQFRNWAGPLGKMISACLARIDARLSSRQRRWLFCLVLLCWSGFLFYLLGVAVRTPPVNFVLPFAAESSQAGMNRSK